MILGDKNRSILLSSEEVIIHRINSIIKVTNSGQLTYSNNQLTLPRCYDSKVYDFAEGRMTSIKTGEQREFKVGTVKDYFKYLKEFYFVTQNNFLVDSTGKKMAEIGPRYQFDGSFIYYIKNLTLYRTDVVTREITEVFKFEKEPTAYTFKCKEDVGNLAFSKDTKLINNENCKKATAKSNIPCNSSKHLTTKDVIAFADLSNKIHIFTEKSYRVYHWMNTTVSTLFLLDDYIFAISKDGKIAKFSINLHKIEYLFSFNGAFTDVKIRDNKIYLLSELEFIIFDLATNNFEMKEFLLPEGFYEETINIGRYEDASEKDIFNRKKRTSVEILNLLPTDKKGSIKSSPIEISKVDESNKTNSLLDSKLFDQRFLVSVSGSNITVFSTEYKKVISFYKIEHAANYCSGSYVISFTKKSSNYCVNVFSVYLDKLILSYTLSISAKKRIDFVNAYFLNEILYIRTAEGLFKVTKLGLLEKIAIINLSTVIYTTPKLCIIDDKGLYSLVDKSYIIKQKNIKNYLVMNDRIFFNIDGLGIYLENFEKKLVLDIKNVYDMKAHVCKMCFRRSTEGKCACVLEILYFSEGKYISGLYSYSEQDQALVEASSFQVDSMSNKIVTKGFYMSNNKQLIN